MREDPASSARTEEIVVLGRIVDAYGLQGGLKVHLFADDPQRIAKMRHWWLGKETRPSIGWTRMKISACRPRAGVLLASLDGIVDRTAAEAVRGCLVGAPRAELPETEPDEYYWGDLVGLEVVNTRGMVLGRVVGLIETPANDVLRVQSDGDPEQLLPFVAAVVLDVDLQARCMRVDWEKEW